MFSAAIRNFRTIQKTTHMKEPIVYPKTIPAPPVDSDYELLKVHPDVTNRDLIQSFRQLTFAIHPATNPSPKANSQYLVLAEAYDRIALHRMAEHGVPQPYSEAYYPPATHTKVIREFLEENAYWMPHVRENYIQMLFMFWATFGVCHTLLQIYNPFLISN